MTQSTMMVAPAPPSPAESEVRDALDLGDATGLIALIAEVDAIFCVAEAPLRQRPTPPAVGCALRGPRQAGRSHHRPSPRQHSEPVRRVDPMQRSPPPTRSTCPQPNPITIR